MTTTIVPTLTVESAALDAVKYDMYRNIHKGIRYVLGGVTTSAGRVDPGDDTAVEALGAQWHDIVRLLVGHAEHENEFIGPLLDIHAPALGGAVPQGALRRSIPGFTLGGAAYVAGTLIAAFWSPVIALVIFLALGVYYLFEHLPSPAEEPSADQTGVGQA